MQTNLFIEKSLKDITMAERNTFLLAFGKIIFALSNDDYVIVGHEIVPKPFDKDILLFLSNYSLVHLVYEHKLYSEITYILTEIKYIAECISLSRISDVLTMHITKTRPIQELCTPQIREHLCIKDDFKWYIENAYKFRAVIFLSTEQKLSLHIISLQISCNEVLRIILSAFESYHINYKACDINFSFR
jgi:hypothetical protein